MYSPFRGGGCSPHTFPLAERFVRNPSQHPFLRELHEAPWHPHFRVDLCNAFQMPFQWGLCASPAQHPFQSCCMCPLSNPHVVLLTSNVMTLIQFSDYCFLFAYLQVCSKYQNLQDALLHLHIYTGGMPEVWPIHAVSLDPIGHFKMNNFEHIQYINFI